MDKEETLICVTMWVMGQHLDQPPGVSSDTPQSMNEADTPVRDSTVAVQGIHPTLVDRSSDEEQPRTSSSGNRCVALIDDESREDDDLHEGPEFVMDEDVPGSSTDTCGRSRVMVETRVRAGSPSCPCECCLQRRIEGIGSD